MNVVELGKGKLSDPILMEWALHRYREARTVDDGLRVAMEESWFDTESLRGWLDGDPDALASLFVDLPKELFTPLAAAIGERWEDWSDDLAGEAAPILAQIEPELAWRCFEESRYGLRRDNERVLGILQSLPHLQPENARFILADIAEDELDAFDESALPRDIILGELATLALRLDRPLAGRIIHELLAEAESEEKVAEVLHTVENGLFDGSPYQALVAAIRRGESQQTIAALAPFFRDGAPLAELDRLSRQQVTAADVMPMVDAWVADERSVIDSIIESLKAKRLPGPHLLVDFLIGTVAAACARETLEPHGLGWRETLELCAADLSESRYLDSLLHHLEQFPPAMLIPAILEIFARERNNYGGIALTSLMGTLRSEPFIAPLSAAMNEDSDEWLCTAAAGALRRIGAPARDHLIGEWDRLDSSQRIYATSVIAAIGGARAAEFTLEHLDALFADIEIGCELALGAPDRRVLERLEPHLRRRQNLLDETFYSLARLLDVDSPALAPVTLRIGRQRADQAARQAAFARGEWFTPTLPLGLRCSACGDTNEYEVRRLALSATADRYDTVLAEELACASCGEIADFELAPGAHYAVSAELAKLGVSLDRGVPAKSQVLIVAEAPLAGRRRPVADVIEHCEANVERDPESIADWLRLGSCYQVVLSRPQYAAQFFDRALELEPLAVEAALHRAHALTADRREEEAFRLLDSVLPFRDRWRLFLVDVTKPADLSIDFARLYNELLDRTGRADRPPLQERFLGASRKVGRNDPCPCGSGKKYKKCCLTKS